MFPAVHGGEVGRVDVLHNAVHGPQPCQDDELAGGRPEQVVGRLSLVPLQSRIARLASFIDDLIFHLGNVKQFSCLVNEHILCHSGAVQFFIVRTRG